MKIIVASKSQEKLLGIREAFSSFFGILKANIEVVGREVDSGVPKQPFDKEIYEGCDNRLKSIMKEQGGDFYVSCEAGVETDCMGNYFNIQVVEIFSPVKNLYAYGKSAGWHIPTKDIEEIKNSSVDKYLRKRGITALEDFMKTTRADLVTEAVKMALGTSRLNS